jgi:hypothetical protein
MKTNKLTTFTLIIAITLTATLTGTATAITGNSKPDTTPYVGVVVLFADAARTQPISYCSGFLISPTVMITAGHSLLSAQSVSVCFDQGPISYGIQDGQIVYYGAETIYNGNPVAYPGYYPTLAGNQEFQTSDIGLIILDQPVSGVTEFPTLPTAGFTDTLPKKTELTVIGYGLQDQVTPKNNGPANSWIGTVSRNSATVQLLNSNFQGSDYYLKLTADTAQGKGAIVFGDSGGPVIYQVEGQDVVVAVNAFVSSVNCNGVSYHTRLDTAQVLAWVTSYLA